MSYRFYLAKTDPETYSIEQLRAERRTTWDGVRNAQAVRAIRNMKTGDRVFIYHSMENAAVVGLAQAVSEPRDDPRDSKLAVIDLEFLRLIEPPVTLREIKESHLFEDWALVRQSRLSTMEAPATFARWVQQTHPGLKF